MQKRALDRKVTLDAIITATIAIGNGEVTQCNRAQIGATFGNVEDILDEKGRGTRGEVKLNLKVTPGWLGGGLFSSVRVLRVDTPVLGVALHHMHSLVTGATPQVGQVETCVAVLRGKVLGGHETSRVVRVHRVGTAR